ncbi:hypothetical protein VHEMI01793 [[Torrubiella] hemipterigena]|uniref:Uncharacterized protein n=1 Tax=[Torrubiella] hemipterigena TaxID=1531966 RepID=A0A0A1T5X5_9HYPO|nr:hypothetical protein VHEMI01793 [[Torrubiella] hemipterigena]
MADGIEVSEVVYPPISASKQNRINIWRTEVATALLPADNASVASPSDSCAPSSSTTSTKSSSFSRRSALLARGRNFFSGIARRLSGNHRDARSETSDGPIRTEMYTTLRPDYIPGNVDYQRLLATHNAADENGEVSLGESNLSGRDAALRERQDRLRRAAKLLQQPALNKAPVPVIA